MGKTTGARMETIFVTDRPAGGGAGCLSRPMKELREAAKVRPRYGVGESFQAEGKNTCKNSEADLAGRRAKVSAGQAVAESGWGKVGRGEGRDRPQPRG